MNEAQKHAIGLIATAYNDCADIADDLAGGSGTGLQLLSAETRMAVGIVLSELAKVFRKKADRIEGDLSLALSEGGEA